MLHPPNSDVNIVRMQSPTRLVDSDLALGVGTPLCVDILLPGAVQGSCQADASGALTRTNISVCLTEDYFEHNYNYTFLLYLAKAVILFVS